MTDALDRLTPMQRRALLAYAATGSQKEAARNLCLSVSTVKNHMSSGVQRAGLPGTARAIYLLGVEAGKREAGGGDDHAG